MRKDIQFLRGIAVLAVVVYHSNIGLVKQGYLGVDVFFVLSGFLITSIIIKGLAHNKFDFSEFYLRRAKRLLPALYCTLFFTTLLAIFLLTAKQWHEYLHQLIGALTFTANIVLPTQTGYFESASDGKPLLHIWSLSLEEQFYFLLPLLLYFTPARLRLTCIIVFSFLSLGFCLFWVYAESQGAPVLWRISDASKSEWAFYLVFTRAWELLAGSICALITLRSPQLNLHQTAKFIALGVIFFILNVSISNEHPSLDALIIVIATAVILLGSKNWLPNTLFARLIEKAGDWSYSIYLVHWPLFAFAYLSYVGDIPNTTKIVLLFLSLFLGFCQYHFIEKPFRKGQLEQVFSSWKIIFTTTLFLISVPLVAGVAINNDSNEFTEIRRVNHGIGKACEGSFDAQGKLKDQCILGSNPKVLVWGDSYAMHLVPGLSNRDSGLIQITKSVCGPFVGAAPVVGSYDSVWAKSCIDFNDNAMKYLKNSEHISHVVLSANFDNYLRFGDAKLLTRNGVQQADYDLILAKFTETIESIKSSGKRPVVFSPLPQTGFNIGECLERMYSDTLFLRKSCDITTVDYLAYQSRVNKFLKDIEAISQVIWLKDYLCNEHYCQTTIDNKFIYRDKGHFTIEGSKSLLTEIQLY